MEKPEIVGKKFKVYQSGKLEGIAKVIKVEIYDSSNNGAYCVVKFANEPDRNYNRWIQLSDGVI